MKFTEHTKLVLDNTCTVLWNHEDKQVSSLPTKTINGETYYLLAENDSVKVLEGANYKDGDKLYLKDGCKNEIIKEDFDHWRAMAKTFVFNGEDKYIYQRSNNYYVRCW